MDVHRKSVRRLGDEALDSMKVAPFGSYGAGLWTGHPIGLVILSGLLFAGFAEFPEAAWFFALAVPAGAVCRFFIWFRHRTRFAAR